MLSAAETSGTATETAGPLKWVQDAINAITQPAATALAGLLGLIESILLGLIANVSNWLGRLLLVPEFNQFFDDEGEPTLTYGMVYRFGFKKLSLKWVITRTIFAGVLTWALIKFPIISSLWNWIF